jgi:hypothetical protein
MLGKQFTEARTDFGGGEEITPALFSVRPPTPAFLCPSIASVAI